MVGDDTEFWCDLYISRSTFAGDCGAVIFLPELKFFFIFGDEYIEIEVDSGMVKGFGLEHGEEVEPL